MVALQDAVPSFAVIAIVSRLFLYSVSQPAMALNLFSSHGHCFDYYLTPKETMTHYLGNRSDSENVSSTATAMRE
jgi:hypothetical protein